MKSSAGKIQMTSYEELFQTDGIEDSGIEKVMEIALSDLYPFKDHPFKVLDDEAMQDTVESIKAHGVLVPGIARPRSEGGYELISGHRRRHGSELAGKAAMPVLVRDLDDDESTIIMVDSNIQRENLLLSEKAWAYKMKLDAIRRKAGRPTKNNPRQVGENYSVDILSENSNDSARNIHRFIRLTELLPDLLQMADDKKLPFNPAVELSYLSQPEQETLLKLMTKLTVIPSLEQTKRLKKYSQDGKLDKNVMDAILTEERPKALQVTLKSDKLKQFFPKNYTQAQMEEVIFSLLETWKMKQT